MEVNVSVCRRYVKNGPIEEIIRTKDNNAHAATILDNDHYGAIGFNIAIRATEPEYVIAMLDVIKDEYEKLLKDRKEDK